jgi:hypothetical protein
MVLRSAPARLPLGPLQSVTGESQMSSLNQNGSDIKPQPLLLSLRAASEGRASMLSDKPIDEAIAVANGEAAWLSEAPKPHCDLCESYMDCPRCGGHGVRQVIDNGGVVWETCTSCEGTGELDRETADVIRRLMDEADWRSDPERGQFCRDYEDRVLRERMDADAWDDTTRWATCDFVPDDAPEPTLVERLELEISLYRKMRSDFGNLIADKLQNLKTVVEATGAKTVAEFIDRRQAMLDGL